MRVWIGIGALVAGLVMFGPAVGDDGRGARSRLDPGQLLSEIVGERDVTLAIAYLRAVLAAAIEGRSAPPVPEELSGRVDALAHALRGQGAVAALALLAILEQRAKEALRDAVPPPARPALPPVQPFTRT